MKVFPFKHLGTTKIATAMFYKISVLENFAKFTGKCLFWGFFLKKLPESSNFFKIRLQRRCFKNSFFKRPTPVAASVTKQGPKFNKQVLYRF